MDTANRATVQMLNNATLDCTFGKAKVSPPDHCLRVSSAWPLASLFESQVLCALASLW